MGTLPPHSLRYLLLQLCLQNARLGREEGEAAGSWARSSLSVSRNREGSECAPVSACAHLTLATGVITVPVTPSCVCTRAACAVCDHIEGELCAHRAGSTVCTLQGALCAHGHGLLCDHVQVVLCAQGKVCCVTMYRVSCVHTGHGVLYAHCRVCCASGTMVCCVTMCRCAVCTWGNSVLCA